MVSDLNIEVFAYKWFHRILVDEKTLPREYDVTEVYKDEYLAYSECMEVSNYDELYYAIIYRNRLLEELYFEEIKTQANEFLNSQTDFLCYVLRTCNRVDLFGNLSIFDRVFATCAFVCCLFEFCRLKFSKIIRCAYICWAMYFDEFIDEFYEQGGWTRLKVVAASYKRPLEFLIMAKMRNKMDIDLIKIINAVESYCRFKTNEKIDFDESLTLSWIKFYAWDMHGSSENDLDNLTEKSYSKELKSFSEIEDCLKHLKYLCDPNGSEVVNALSQMSSIDTLDTSMANLNICNKHLSLQSEADTILGPTLEQNTTLVNSDNNTEEEHALTGKTPDKSDSTSLYISSEQNCFVQNGSISEDDPVKMESFQLQNQAQDLKTIIVNNLFENMTISNCKDKKKLKKNTILPAQLPSTNTQIEDKNIKNTLKEKNYIETKNERNGLKIKKDVNKITTVNGRMFITEDNHKQDERKVSSKTQNGINKEQDEVTKVAKRSQNLIEPIPLAVEKAEKENNYKMLDEATRELVEWKGTKKLLLLTDEANDERKNDKIKGDSRQNNNKGKKEKKRKKANSIPMREMFYETQNDEAENKEIKKSIREEREDDDIKNFLRMFLVLGDKQGINYVKKTSKLNRIKLNV